MKRDLIELARKKYDVLVIGGGIYGAFVAWDAALRGLSVGLVEKGDFGHATSSNTLRIIHGGLRYVQHGDIRRMRRSIYERTVFMRIAPHLVHPLPFLIPTYGHVMQGKAIMSLALFMDQIIGFDRNRLADPQKHLPRGRVIPRGECLRLFPGVRDKGLTGGAIYYDCQMYDSERLILSIARSAVKAGADIANYAEVTELLREGTRVCGVTARDVLTRDTLDIRAKIVVNTSGPWLNRVLSLLNGLRPNRKFALSKAFNLLVSRQFVPEYAVGVYNQTSLKDKDRDATLSNGPRWSFITPWRNCSLIGTAHLPYDADPDNVKVTEGETQDFLDTVNEAYPAAGLRREDVAWVYSGLLPMVRNSNGTGHVPLVKRYRIHDHNREEGIEGLVSVAGVKFTEARHVAEKTVDLVFRKFGRKSPKSFTAWTPLHGGQIEHLDDFFTQHMKHRPHGLREEIFRNLIYRYGSSYSDVLKYLDEDPGGSKNMRLGDKENPISSRIIKAEVIHAIRSEMAQRLADIVLRRTELSVANNPEAACLGECAAIMSEELGWDATRKYRELEEVNAVLSNRTGS